ncbi:DNA-binding domain-containing protein [Fodinibius sp. N2]|uniref:DNA-binding domain-containing protein n=1 Tax=Fodinibius alkaliphilus TaxID=3140241 RepID=UPI00315A6849
MSIKYALYPNHLTDDPDDHLAIVQDQKSRTIEDIIDIMISRGSTVTKADALSVIEEYESAIEKVLRDGDSIKTPLIRIRASIQGVFKDELDPFDPERHSVSLNVNAGARIRQIADDISAERVPSTLPKPSPQTCKDIASGTTNETLTPGGVGELRGSRLKVDPDDSNQGVFFIASDGSRTRAEVYIRTKPSNLMFMIPDTLTSGSYHIEVFAAVKNSSKIRSSKLNDALVVL